MCGIASFFVQRRAAARIQVVAGLVEQQATVLAMQDAFRISVVLTVIVMILITVFDEAERSETMRDFVDALAALHNLDVDALALDGFARPRRPEDHARFDLDTWARLARTSVTQPFKSAPGISNSGTWSVGSASPGKIKHAKLFGTNVS